MSRAPGTGPRLRITVLHEGPLLWPHGSRRALQQVLHLAARHDLTVVPLIPEGLPQPGYASDLAAAGVAIGPAIALPPDQWWAGIAPGLWSARRGSTLAGALQERVQGSDWTLVTGATLAASSCVRRAAPQDSVVTWDGDAPASYHRTSASFHRSQLLQATKDAARAASWLAVGRKMTSQYDLMTVPTSSDARELGAHGRTVVVPNPLPLAQDALTAVGHLARRELVFLGSDYGPNIEGLQWFFDEVWSEVLRRRPETVLTVVGRGLERHLFDGDPRNVEWVGEVDSVAGVLSSANLFICPIFYGGGSPNKVVEAAAHGLRVLTTPFVASRLPALDLEIAVSADRWTELVLRGAGAPVSTSLREQLSQQAQTLAGPAAFREAMGEVVEAVRERLSVLRGQ